MIIATPALLLGVLVFTVCCLLQNAMFTWSSRSRNSGDWNYHRRAAWASNGIYFITNALITLYIMKFTGIWYLAVQGLLYTVAASEGSVYMMRKLIQSENGKRKVGNQFNEEEVALLRQIAGVYAANVATLSKPVQ